MAFVVGKPVVAFVVGKPVVEFVMELVVELAVVTRLVVIYYLGVNF